MATHTPPDRWRIRLCPADREKFGGPEWFEFDPEQLADAEFDELDRLDALFRREMGPTASLTRFLYIEADTFSALAFRGLAFLARYQAGLVDKARLAEEWAAFKPKPFRMDLVPLYGTEGDDADPPGPGDSSEPSPSASS